MAKGAGNGEAVEAVPQETVGNDVIGQHVARAVHPGGAFRGTRRQAIPGRVRPLIEVGGGARVALGFLPLRQRQPCRTPGPAEEHSPPQARPGAVEVA